MVAEVFVVLASGYNSAQVGYHKNKKCRSLQLVLMKRIQISGAVPCCSPCVFIAPKRGGGAEWVFAKSYGVAESFGVTLVTLGAGSGTSDVCMN